MLTTPHMLYSVYNYGTKLYDYYAVNGGGRSAHAPAPQRARGASAMGATPEQAAWKLPAGARHVGSGEEARGLIASSNGGGGLGGIIGDSATGFELVGAGILLFTLWKVFK